MTADVDRIRALCKQGLNLQAFRAAQELGPLESWQGPELRILAGRLASRLGGNRLSLSIFLRTARQYPDHPEAVFYGISARLNRRGPVRAWQSVRSIAISNQWPSAVRAEWHGMRAQIFAIFRDFTEAEAELSRAMDLQPDDPWYLAERASMLAQQDHYDQALEVATAGLRMQPFYPPAVRVAAHLMELGNRDQDAMELLQEASVKVESADILHQLAALQMELGQHEQARKTLSGVESLSPLLDREGREFLAGQRSDAAYRCGDATEALALAKVVKRGFFAKIAENLEKNGDQSRRVLLPVGFVRQHHMTCAPAVLATISRFWDMPAEHLEIAEQICYDGTPHHNERRWGETHGWATREFRTTWDAAVALLDRGVAFTLTTMFTTSSHLQTVVGYDARRRTLLIRDPYFRDIREMLADSLFEVYKASGARGMAMVPRERQELLDGLELPDADLYDVLYQLHLALKEYRREEAAELCRQMEAKDAAHYLTLTARYSLADYDSDPAARLEAVEGQWKLHPADPRLQVQHILAIRAMSKPVDWLAALEEAARQPHADPLFWQMLADQLSYDARQQARALKLNARALRYRPVEAGAHTARADLLWRQRRFDEAIEHYRFATCISDKHEGYAKSYFTAARFLRRTDVALNLLRERFDRFGKLSGLPARTLCWAYSGLQRQQAALDVAERAVALRPDDGQVLLDAAQLNLHSGQPRRAAELIDQAQSRALPGAWLRAAAGLAQRHGDRVEANQRWRQILDDEPRAIDAHRAIALALAEDHGRTKAIEHLDGAIARFPHLRSLYLLRHEWLYDNLERQEVGIRGMLAINPNDPWALRELASILARQAKLEVARQAAAQARQVEPLSHATFNILGMIEERAGRLNEAAEAYRRAIELDVDNSWAFNRLLDCCPNPGQRREALNFIWQQLVAQVVYGPGLVGYREAATDLSPEELQAQLRIALEARPDLWETWSVMINQFRRMGRLEEALSMARETTERFPLKAQAWLDLATVHRVRTEARGEAKALHQTLRLAPNWVSPIRALFDLHVRKGRFARAQRLAERAADRNPLVADFHACVADALWRQSKGEPALVALRRALELNPTYDWAWNALRRWSQKLQKMSLPAEMARELAQRRPGNARSWLILARVLSGPKQFDERLAALEKAAKLEPRLVEGYDMMAEMLAYERRFSEALSACNPPVFAEHLPFALRGRAAWVQAQSGKRDQAVAAMREVVRDEPNYYWGWLQLADWYAADKDPKGYREAAENLVRLAPHDAGSLTRLGEARLRGGDREGAKSNLRRAMELAPHETAAGLKLLDIHIADKNVQAAEEVLQVIGPHLSAMDVAGCKGRIAAAGRNFKTAQEMLTTLCLNVDTKPSHIHMVFDAMTAAGSGQEAIRILDAAGIRPDSNVNAIAVHIEHLGKRGLIRRCTRILRGVRHQPSQWNSGAKIFLSALAKKSRRLPLAWFVFRNRNRLRQDDAVWGTTGYALSSAGLNRAAVRWLTPWPQRAKPQPWVLYNLSLSLRRLGRWRQADQVSRAALDLEADHTSGLHDLWLALEDAITGEYAEAHARFLKVDPTALSKPMKIIWTMADGLTRVGGINKNSDASQALRLVLQNGRKARTLCPGGRIGDMAISKAYRRSLWSAAKKVKTIPVWLSVALSMLETWIR